jgi:hypothetical protein
MLMRALVLVGGVVGLGAAGAEARPFVYKPGKSSRVKFHGRNWQLSSPDRLAGQLPVRGERMTMYGELLDRAGGKKIGEFYGAHVSTLSPFGQTPFAAGALEMHTFNLTDGTIVGMGSHWGGTGTYAIVGGTGRYNGIRGSYAATQRPLQLRGDGTAEFVLDLIA